MAGYSPDKLEKACVPNSLANALLSLHSDIERQLSSGFVQPDTAPVPPPHDELAFRGRPIRVLGENRELAKGVISDSAFQTNHMASLPFLRQSVDHACSCVFSARGCSP